MTSFFSMTRALVARKRKIFALFFALAASIGLSWAQNLSGECGPELTWEFEEATGKLTISGTGTMLDYPYWKNEGLNSRITSVSLPEGLTDIRDYVFANCEKLESITLPSGLTSIGYGAFMNCIALREITLPGSLTTLGERAFYNCEKLEAIKLPEGITTLGNDVFSHCNHLQSVTLPPSLTTLGEDVFRECSRLEAITLPDGLTSIGNNAFSGCHYLGSIILPEGVTFIGSSAFEYCGIESIKLPEGITTLGTGVFSNCDRLQSVTLPPSLTSIGDWAFNGCWNLASVTLPESVTSIGANAFSSCGVTSMTLPAGVTTIGEEAFSYCTSLTEFTNKAATPQTISANVFSEVTLSNITLNVPGTSKAAYEAADVWKDFGTKATLPPAITKTITDNGMTYDIYDNGVVKVSGTGIVAARIFAANDHDYVPSVKRFEFADDCKVYSFGEDWYMYYTSYSPLEAVDIKTTLPFVAGRESVFYKKENGSDESVTVTITAPAIASIGKKFVANYGTPQHIIFNMPVTTFEKSWCSYLREIDTVTIPTGSLYHLPASYAFKDEYKQFRYDDMVAEGMEDMFWKYEASGLVEGVDYTRTEEETGVITAENETKVFGKAVVKYQAPQEAPATSWTFWRSDDFKTFPELENGSSHTCKDVTLKIVDGSSTIINMSGSYITLSTSATNGIQLIAPKGKIFKQVIALDRSLRTSLIWTGEADTVGISSDLMQISLIEFELDAAPASVTLPEAVTGLVYNGEAQTLIAAGEAAGYTFQYKVGENGEYSTDLPTATDAGSYTVYYKATAEGEQDITGSLEVSIAKADINLGGSEGALKGKFFVAGGKVVYFSQGNLQYNSNTQAWQFAGNQYDYVGDAAGNTSVTESGIENNNGTVDLFGWVGASSTWTGLKQYGITALDDAAMNVTDGYGNSDSEALKSDWGTTMGEGWFTLSTEQWTYLFNTRTGDKAATVNSVADCRYTKATINTDGTAVRGIILFPDGGTFAASEFTEVGSPNTGDANYTTTCTTAQWNALQTKGCVFLPAAGNRVGTSMTAAGWAGYYWSSSPDPFDMSSAYCAYFGPDNVNPAINDFRFYGYSVRLVTETAPASVTLPKAVAGLTANGEAKTLITAGACEGGTFYYSLDKENWSTTLPTGTEAQDYTVYYYVKGDANHNDSKTYSLTASIGTLPQALLGLVYTGEAQTLVSAGEVAGFTYQYKVGDAEYSTDLPKATDAGSYTVYYKATAEGEQDITGSLEVSIAKADINVNEGGTPVDVPEGAVKGAFSVAEGKVVCFSKGNLQYQASTNTWRFAANQYDAIGSANSNISASYSGWIDLFGWGTGNNPTNSSTGDSDYATFTDWGTNMGEGWYTLSKDEWYYIFYTRTNAASLFGLGSVNGVNGLIILPDNWVTPAGASFTPSTSQGLAAQSDYYYNENEDNFSHNTYTAEQWSAMEAAGAVFLPAAGLRDGTDVYNASSDGYYWSSTPNDEEGAHLMYFGSVHLNSQGSHNRNFGQSVRLVTKTALASSVTLPEAVEELAYSAEKQALISAGECADGTFQYKVGENGTWVDTLPKVTDAGTYQVYYKIQGDKNHNDYIAAEPLEVSIAKAALTITAENKEVVYGYAAPGFSVSYYGLQGSDLPADVLTGELSYACDYTVGSNAASYDIVPSGQTSANYDITYVKGTLVVYKADPAFTEPVANTLTYNGGAQTLIAAGTTEQGTFEYTFTPNDEESWNTALPQAKDADTYGVYYRVVGDANHNDYESADAVVVTIAKAALTATADDKSVIYGDDAPEYTVTYEGWQGEDDADVLSGTIAYACEYAPTSIVGEYTITPSGVSNPNYAITFVNGKVTVSKAALTITAEDKEVTYGDEAPAFTVTYEGFKNEDDETVVSGLTLTSEYVLTSNVGEYDIVPADATAQNYAITFVNGTLTVNRAALTITAEDKEVTYGDEAPAFTASYEGFKNADDESVVSGLTLTSEYVLTSNVGEYDIVPADATAQNYAISYTKGTLTVNKAALMITAEDKEVIYGDEAPAFTASYEGFKNADDKSVVSGLTLTSEYVLTSNVGEYDIVPANATAQNYEISFTNGTLTVNQAALTITAEDKTMFYGNEAPEFTVTYAGWKNEDNEAVVSGLKYTCEYQPGSYIGAYSIEPNSATAQNYAITFVDGTLTVNKAAVIVSGAKVQIAKFEDGTTDAVILDKGILNGVMLNDPVDHITTATFSDATVGEGKTIKMFYELSGNPVLLLNYDLILTAEDYIEEGTIIENFIPDNNPSEKEDESVVKEGIEVYAYGYCDGSGYSLRYHLNSGNPDQYKIEFADPRFEDVDWTDLETPGKDGTININIPVDLPTGDYSMTVTFRDSRFEWLESNALNVTFHMNLPETYVVALFDNVMAVVDTCECLTDIQWYWRANSTDQWQAIEGATGYYYKQEGGLSGEYFIHAKMNGVDTYTCPQDDMTLYGYTKQAKVRAYPNPVVNTTTVTIENSYNYEHTLRVVNLMGNEMMTTSFEGNETTVDMDGFVQGNYMISVDGIVVKVMKQ